MKSFQLGIYCLFFLVSRIHATVFYVNTSNTVPVSPFSSWPTAATNIQDAIDASSDGDLILVTNGVYKFGGGVVYGSLTNRVVINKAVTVQSMNGPAKTFILGNPVLGNNAVRCAYLTNNATLTGFTLTNGATRKAGNTFQENSGGGVWGESGSSLVSNCVIIANSAFDYGGGSFSGTLVKCYYTNNTTTGGTSQGGGAIDGLLTNCILSANQSFFGGGACSNVLINCTLTGNSASMTGGGTYSCVLTNCVLSGNYATNGGGAIYGRLVGCTLTNNSAVNGGGVCSNSLYDCLLITNMAITNGGGAYGGNLTSCILAGNWAIGYGGGSFNANLTNCTLILNFAHYGGGGAAKGTCSSCLITNNIDGPVVGMGGGVLSNTLFNCTLIDNSNGASAYSTLNRCWLTGNYQGGSYDDILSNCVIQFTHLGDGAYQSTLYNCTVWENGYYGGNAGYGIHFCNAYNSIIYSNNFMGNSDAAVYNIISNCCIFPLASFGSNEGGNFTNAPLFLDNEFHQQSNSPTVGAGNSSFAAGTVDIDGRPRTVNGTVDVGATEFQSATIEPFISWLGQYDLPDDGSVDYADSDGTGMNNWQKWIAGLNPTNPASILALSPPLATNNPSGIVVNWQSVNTRTYYLQRSTNLTAFSALQSNLVGQAGTTSFTDTTATNGGPYFYRIGIQ